MPPSYGQIKTTGKIYRASLNDKDSNFNKGGNNLDSYFLESLKQNGWSGQSHYGNYRILGMAADGVDVSTIGIVKLNGYLARTIIYNYWIVRTEGETEDNSYRKTSCPCTLDMSIYISDPVDIRSYLTSD